MNIKFLIIFVFFSLSGKVDSAMDLSAVHGWLMGFAWLVLLPAAAFIARFMKGTLGKWWFHLHRALTLLAVVRVRMYVYVCVFLRVFFAQRGRMCRFKHIRFCVYDYHIAVAI